MECCPLSPFRDICDVDTVLDSVLPLVVVVTPKKTKTIIVLAKMNDGAFRSLKEKFSFTFEFCVVKVGDPVPLATGVADTPWSRSGSLELEIDAGSYVVYVKIIRSRVLNPKEDYADWNLPPREYPELVNVCLHSLSNYERMNS